MTAGLRLLATTIDQALRGRGAGEGDETMQLGIVGLGRMGGNMARRLMRGGHDVIAYARNPAALEPLSRAGATGTTTLDDLVTALRAPRVAWVMVPAGAATEQVVMDLARA